ncbi:MAG: polyphenol oxidase family protein [bacterium]|nr:polyphenol oxidase family protein [bacterium]MDD5354017.1 polyphenol oxidase family protein [bacterium]MDD5755914.1 polyphenol oxidase family protein [bacterium]
MRKGIFTLPRFSKNHTILQGTTSVSLGDFNFFHGHHRILVREDIKILKKLLCCEKAPLVLVEQVHGCRIKAVRTKPKTGISYFSGFDALMTAERGLLIGILTADCLPVFLFDRRQNVIGLAHAGWRGIAKKIVPATINRMIKLYGTCPADIIAGIGPHISAKHYEIDSGTARQLGLPAKNSTPADLAKLVRDQLRGNGVPGSAIEISPLCTYSSRQCYSYRRQGKKAGRLLSFLLLK